MNKQSKNYTIILASGSSERLNNLKMIKQFAKIAGKTVIEHTLDVFEKNEYIDEIIIVTKKEYKDFCNELVIKNKFNKVSQILEGGSTRQESSKIAIFSINGNDEDNVLIHDAVRPFISNKIINDCINALGKYKAVDVAIQSADTIIKVNTNNIIDDIPKRKFLMRGQTPQAFKLGLIKQAHKLAQEDKTLEVTDDCGIIKKYNLADIFVVQGSDYNIKITYPLDIDIADKLFQIKSFNATKINLELLKDKVIVVFGASRGIGKSITEIAKKYNAKVYGFSRTNDINIANHQDVEKALKFVYEKEGKIDSVINTAGVLRKVYLENESYEDIQNDICTNYIGSINVIKESIKYLKQTKGAILLFASSSYTRGRESYSIYSSTKSALVNLTQAVAEEISKDNIRINIINPERTATPMRFENFGEENINTLLSPDSVAVASLCTILSTISGQIINITKSNEEQFIQ